MRKNTMLVAMILVLLMTVIGCTANINPNNQWEEVHNNVATTNNVSTIDVLTDGKIVQDVILNDELYHEWTVEELGELIVTVGMFWEDWWVLRGKFDIENIGDETWANWQEEKELSVTTGVFGNLLPSSGFKSINDIYDYLSQFYTESWIEAEMYNEFPKFIEYNGMPFVDVSRFGIEIDWKTLTIIPLSSRIEISEFIDLPRPNWESAMHTIVEQDNERIVVDTIVCWGFLSDLQYTTNSTAVLYRFTFIDGKIDTVENPYWRTVMSTQVIKNIDRPELETIIEWSTLLMSPIGDFDPWLTILHKYTYAHENDSVIVIQERTTEYHWENIVLGMHR